MDTVIIAEFEASLLRRKGWTNFMARRLICESFEVKVNEPE